MATLSYLTMMSLDGYVADRDGRFDWSMPSEEVHAFVNDLARPIGTYLYGRRLYDVMIAWETMPTEDEPQVVRDFAQLWRAADKVVFSRSLRTANTSRTRVESTFDPDGIRRLLARSDSDLSIGGPELANLAISAGLVDDYHFLISPVVVGGGTPALTTRIPDALALVAQRGFANGVSYLHYRR